MHKNGVILLIVLLCVAFLVSCTKKDTAEVKQGELVRTETEGNAPSVFFPVMVMITLGIKWEHRMGTSNGNINGNIHRKI